MLGSGKWVDIGARAAAWGGTDNETTCTAYNATTSNRRDYIFTTSTLLLLVVSYDIGPMGVIPVHRAVLLTLRVNAPNVRCLRHTTIPLIDDMKPDPEAYDQG